MKNNVKKPEHEVVVTPKSIHKPERVRFFLEKPEVIKIDEKLKKIYRITN